MDARCSVDGNGLTILTRCNYGLDVSLGFQRLILLMIPSLVFLPLAIFRCQQLWRTRPRASSRSLFGFVTTVAGIAYFASTIAALAFCLQSTDTNRQQAIAAMAIVMAAAMMVAPLFWLEHRATNGPSLVLQAYLVFMVGGFAIQTHTLWSLFPASGRAVSSLLEACFGVIVLILASWPSRGQTDSKSSPEAANGLFSKRLFLWLNAVFWKGYRTHLQIDDLFSTDTKLAPKKLMPENSAKQRSLFTNLVIALKTDLLKPMIPKALFIAASFTQPFLVRALILYVEEPEPDSTRAPWLIVAVALDYLALALFGSWYWQAATRFTTKVRASLTAEIYNAVLTRSPEALASQSPLMLMNVNVEKIILGFRIVHEFWAAMVIVVVAIAILGTQLGLVVFAPLVPILVLAVINYFIGSVTRKRQFSWLAATQRRVEYISQLLQSMKSIKMLGVTACLQDRGTLLRKEEVARQLHLRRPMFLNGFIANSMLSLITLTTYFAYAVVLIHRDAPLTNATLFTTLAVLKLLTDPLLSTLQWIPVFFQALASLKNIEHFLYDDKGRLALPQSDVVEFESKLDAVDMDAAVRLTNVSAGYKENSFVLEDICVTIRRGTLTLVTGDIASGKSTFLRILLNEMPHTKGHVWRNSRGQRTGICSQAPWLWDGTIRENIVGPSEFDQDWLSTVVWACCLDADFKLTLPSGVDTAIGPGGNALSGGQRNRVNLARGLYARPEILIADDIFAGLDAKTGAAVWSRVFSSDGVLAKLGTTVVLATHSTDLAREADQTVVLAKGKVIFAGRPNNAPGSLKQLSPKMQETSSTSSMHSDDDVEKETSTSETTSIAASRAASVIEPKTPPKQAAGADWSTYKAYMASFGTARVILYFTFAILFVGSMALQMLWLKWWAAASTSSPAAIWRYVGVFTAITATGMVILALWLAFCFFDLFPRSSIYLHSKQWVALMQAPYHLVSKLDGGNVANRFSQDIALIDQQLPSAFLNSSEMLLITTSNCALLIVATPYIGAILPVLLTILYVLQKFYLRTSKQLRLLDLDAKAPLCAHFIDSVSGAINIRALGWTRAYLRECGRLLSISQKPFYLLASVQNWLQLVLDLVVTGLALTLSCLAVTLRGKIDPGYLGLALTSLIDLSYNFRILITFWTQLETSLGAVSRLVQFTNDLPPDSPRISSAAPGWPSQGTIDFDNLSARYSPSDPCTLQQLNVSIRSGEKVAICGRTGSGKSSLVAAILQLMQPHTGRIVVDGIDLSTLDAETVRQQLVVLPQEPYFLSGCSVRQNLVFAGTEEGGNEAADSDKRILAALDRVGLLGAFGVEQSQVLDTILEPGTMLTRGQMQLFSLARTILRCSRIIVMDEATTGLDASSRDMVWNVVDDVFRECTVLLVSHHVEELMRAQRVIVLNNGRVVQDGDPTLLLDQADSEFRQIVRANIDR